MAQPPPYPKPFARVQALFRNSFMRTALDRPTAPAAGGRVYGQGVPPRRILSLASQRAPSRGRWPRHVSPSVNPGLEQMLSFPAAGILLQSNPLVMISGLKRKTDFD